MTHELTGDGDRSGFSPAARICTARGRCARWSTVARVAEQLGRRFACGRVVWKPVLTGSATIRRACLDANRDDRCIGVIAWMHTFSPAKMWIQGLDELRKPLLHLHTQANESLPWSTIDMDFMNLNQAAHGDREFAHVADPSRGARKTVAGHVGDPRGTPPRPHWMRASAGRGLCATAHGRFGDNMRNVAVTEGDKVEAEHRFGVSVNRFGVNDLVAAVDAVERLRVDDFVDACLDLYDVAAELRPGGERAESLATPRASRSACGPSSTTAGSVRSPRTSRTSAGCASFPGWPCSD